MAATPPPGYTPPPANLPQRGVRATFSQYMDAWITWFTTVILTQLAAMIANAYANAVDAFTSAGASAASAVMSAASAAAAAAYASAPLWASGASYVVGDPARDPTDLQVYIRRVAGAGATRPGLDPTNWRMASAVADNELLITGNNGYGTTNTYIKRYLSLQNQVGTAISYTDSPTLGAQITINETGLYSILVSDGSGSAIGASVNVTNAMANVPIQNTGTIPWANRLMIAIIDTVSTVPAPISRIVRLNVGDVVTPHGGNVPANATTLSMFAIRKISGVY